MPNNPLLRSSEKPFRISCLNKLYTCRISATCKQNLYLYLKLYLLLL
jgi:hypothetical protein